MSEVLDIQLASIEVGTDRARDVDPVWAEALATVISQQGLLSPIVVRKTSDGYRLIAGLHRLHAFRHLGRDTIAALISTAETDDQARLQEVTENLVRHDLIALDRFHHLFEAKQVWERMHPQAKRGGDRRSQMIKTQSLRFDADEAKAPEIMGFAPAYAEHIGMSRRTIENAVKIWSQLSETSRTRLKGTDLARKATELKALSDLEASVQWKVLDLILGDENGDIQNVASALAHLEGGAKVSAVERQYAAISKSFSVLTDSSLDRLLLENEERVRASILRNGWMQ